MVEERKVEYVKCKRLDKPMVALRIIEIWRAQVPPGRFLKMDDKTGLWNDVGDKKAREKTSQALREKAPIIREELEKEKRAKERKERGEPEVDSEDEVRMEDARSSGSVLVRFRSFVSHPWPLFSLHVVCTQQDRRTTRFAAGTNLDGKPGVVARDHSLGREYVSEDGVSLENFTWAGDGQQRQHSGTYPYNPQHPHQVPPPYGYPGSRTSSGTAPPPPYPPQGYPQQVPSFDSRVMSWSSVPSQPPPPMPGYGYPPVQSNSWTQRDHSLAMNPLPNATATQPGYPNAFDHRATSGQWAGPPPPQGYGPYPVQSNGSYHPPPPPPPPNGPPQHHVTPPPAGAVMSPPPAPVVQPYPTAQQQQQHPGAVAPVPMPAAPAPTGPPPMHDFSNSSNSTTAYAVDPAVASQWSASSSNGFPPQQQQTAPPPPPPPPLQQQQHTVQAGGGATPKPDMVKRATSHQNETAETKHGYNGEDSIKRATLDRERSLASSRMKEQYNNTAAAGNETKTTDRPATLTLEERMSTLDLQTLEESLGPPPPTTKPSAVSQRTSTVEALALDFDHPDGQFGPSGLEDLFQESAVPKPHALDTRMTTRDLIEIVNEPFEEV